MQSKRVRTNVRVRTHFDLLLVVLWFLNLNWKVTFEDSFVQRSRQSAEILPSSSGISKKPGTDVHRR